MSAMAERRCALLLTTLHRRDRRRVLAELPRPAAARIRVLVRELESLPFDVADLAGEVLAAVPASTAVSAPVLTPDLDALLRASQQLAPVWFARVLGSTKSVDPRFVVAALDPAIASTVERELARMPALPPALADAVQAEARVLIGQEGAA
ncbi:hypothetical protein ACFFGH_09040 [Lysobacter korlensis]|uniref:Uncharacterized protein n=1 Tax=Lysobacter korlensis TaxID=553636 RepID=A0ABV6RLX7_9GAMM